MENQNYMFCLFLNLYFFNEPLMGSLVTRILLPEVADRVPVQSAGWQPGVYTVVHEASGARVRVVVN